jgi:hypothetical protein
MTRRLPARSAGHRYQHQRYLVAAGRSDERGDGVKRQVQVGHDHGGAGAQRRVRGQPGGREPFVQAHVGQRDDHVAAAIEYYGVGAAAGACQRQCGAGVDAGGACVGEEGGAGSVIADSGHQRDRRPQARQVFGDVAGHAAKRFMRLCGVRRPHLQGRQRAQLAVQVGGADTNDAVRWCMARGGRHGLDQRQWSRKVA